MKLKYTLMVDGVVVSSSVNSWKPVFESIYSAAEKNDHWAVEVKISEADQNNGFLRGDFTENCKGFPMHRNVLECEFREMINKLEERYLTTLLSDS